ncbi:MAG: hypothetical protein V1707_01815 [bacterium]
MKRWTYALAGILGLILPLIAAGWFSFYAGWQAIPVGWLGFMLALGYSHGTADPRERYWLTGAYALGFIISSLAVSQISGWAIILLAVLVWHIGWYVSWHIMSTRNWWNRLALGGIIWCLFHGILVVSGYFAGEIVWPGVTNIMVSLAVLGILELYRPQTGLSPHLFHHEI